MATLEKIRSKAGLLVTVIGIALLAFIVGDLLNSGNTFFRMNQDKVAVINGNRIGTQEFSDKVQEVTDQQQRYYQQNGMSLPAGAAARINQMVYDQMVNEALIKDETEEIGMTVTPEELAELVSGDKIVPQVRQNFTNPQTGEFDKAALQNFLKTIMGDGSNVPADAQGQFQQQKNAWLSMEKEIKQQQLTQKFFTLLSKSIVPNKLDLQALYEESKTSADFAYAMQPYSSIPDSTINVSQSDLKSLYNKKKALFEQDEKRTVKYLVVDILPSEQDRKEAQTKIDGLKDQFVTSQDVASVLSFNTDVPYTDTYVAERSLSPELKAFVGRAGVNTAEGPIMENDTYKMYRLMARKSAPDSVKVRHIVLPADASGKCPARLDSIKNVISNGGDFAALAQKFSLAGTKASGGEIGWVTEDQAADLGQEFITKSFDNGVKEPFIIETNGSYQLVQVTDRTPSIAKVKVAQLIMKVRHSSTTYGNIYNKISQLLSKSNNLKELEENAKADNMMVNTLDLTKNDVGVANVQDARQAVRWAFNAKKGEISEIYSIDNKFLVVAVDNIVEKGYAPMKDVEMYLKQEILAEKKAEKIIADLKAKNLTSLQAYAQAMKTNVVDSVARFVSFTTDRIAGLGTEPVLCGLAPYAPMNKIQGPVKGNIGVYVFEVYNKTENKNPINLKAEKAKYDQSIYTILSRQIMNVMKETADVEDNRIKFF